MGRNNNESLHDSVTLRKQSDGEGADPAFRAVQERRVGNKTHPGCTGDFKIFMEK